MKPNIRISNLMLMGDAAPEPYGDRKQFKKLQNALDYIKDAPVTEDRPCILNLRDFDFTTCYLVWGKRRDEGRIKSC